MRAVTFAAAALLMVPAGCSPAGDRPSSPVKASPGPAAASEAPPPAEGSAYPQFTLNAEDTSSSVYDTDAGEFRRPSPEGLMRISREGREWRVWLRGEAPEGSQATTCTIVARGPLIQGVIVAKVVPYDEPTHSVDAKRAADMIGVVVVADHGAGKRVIERYSDDICGLGSDLNGVYAEVRR